MPLGDEIAVLDGLDLGGLSAMPEDGRIGRTPATGAEYARQPRHGVEFRRNIIDPTEGATYGGGSSYAPGLPLLPSTIGLADADLLRYMRPTGVLPPRKNVIDPGGGALYTGGSSYSPGIPMLPSNAGLVGLGRVDKYSDFGRADQYSDFARVDEYRDFNGLSVSEMDAKFDGLAGSTMAIDDGRIGRTPATGAEYAHQPRHGVEFRRNIIDPTEGATYGGGSSYAPGLPLLPSTIGLAELSIVDVLDGLSDNAFTPKLFQNQERAFMRAASKAKVQELKARTMRLAKLASSPALPYPKRFVAAKKAQVEALKLKKARAIRRNILDRSKADMRRAQAMAAPVRNAWMGGPPAASRPMPAPMPGRPVPPMVREAMLRARAARPGVPRAA